MLRLVQLDDYRLDAYLDGVLLVFHHRDVPGIIGVVGTIFGRYKINIAQMAVGRASKGGEAIGVLNLDQAAAAGRAGRALAPRGDRAGNDHQAAAGRRPPGLDVGHRKAPAELKTACLSRPLKNGTRLQAACREPRDGR